MRHVAAAVILILFGCMEGRVVAETQRGFDSVVIDGVKLPFGKTVEVSGPCRGYEDQYPLSAGAIALRLRRLDGKATQEEFDVHLIPPGNNDDLSYEKLRRLEGDVFYKVRGRLVCARAVGPSPALGLVVGHIEQVPPSPLTFADFVDRSATFEGTARPQGTLETEHGEAQVDGIAAWPKLAEGEKIAVRGVIRRTPDGWRIERPDWHLIDLGVQLGHEVTLDGRLRGWDEHWWFHHRDDDLYLTSASGPKLSFPSDNHGRMARVTGKLVRQDRPSIKTDEETFGALVPCFVLRNAKVEYLEPQADKRSRFGPIYNSFHVVRDGVIELLPEWSLRKNVMGTETDARLYRERNADAIDSIFRDATPETREVLARRMEDSKLPEPLRLLYAGMLLKLDDARGRTFLLSRSDVDGSPSIDAIFCLGAFLSTKPPKDISWAVRPLIALMTSKKLAHPERFELDSNDPVGLKVFDIDVKRFTVADATARFSDIPSLLLAMKSAPARQSVIEYLVTDGKNTVAGNEIIRALRFFDSEQTEYADGETDMDVWERGTRVASGFLPVDELLRLEAATETRYERLAILSQLLRHEHRAAVDEFVGDMKDGFFYLSMRRHLSPEVVRALEAHLPTLSGRAKYHAEVLVVLSRRDPVPALLKRLDDPSWPDKNLVLFELARLADPRVIAPLARILRTASPDFFHVDLQRIAEEAGEDGGAEAVDDEYAKSVRMRIATSSVEHALEAIAHAKTPEAIRTLIELFPIDLARFGTYVDREDFKNGIAAHLIDLTGESFGVDPNAWRDWQTAHPEFGLNP
ncbi:HEAT repeat domain-containing protein [Singulisphaera rosea]